MIIQENMRCFVYSYDHTAKQYAAVYDTALTESSIISASIKRQCCADGGFEIGGAYAATLSMVAKLPNMGLFQVRGAKLVIQTKYATESDWQNMGTFWVTNATRVGEIFTLSAQDAVGWLDTSAYNCGDTAMQAVGKVLYDKNNSGSTIYGTQLNGWLSQLTDCTNTFIQSQTNAANMLE